MCNTLPKEENTLRAKVPPLSKIVLMLGLLFCKKWQQWQELCVYFISEMSQTHLTHLFATVFSSYFKELLKPDLNTTAVKRFSQSYCLPEIEKYQNWIQPMSAFIFIHICFLFTNRRGKNICIPMAHPLFVWLLSLIVLNIFLYVFLLLFSLTFSELSLMCHIQTT